MFTKLIQGFKEVNKSITSFFKLIQDIKRKTQHNLFITQV